MVQKATLDMLDEFPEILVVNAYVPVAKYIPIKPEPVTVAVHGAGVIVMGGGGGAVGVGVGVGSGRQQIS